jgi:hypothetical protein
MEPLVSLTKASRFAANGKPRHGKHGIQLRLLGAMRVRPLGHCACALIQSPKTKRFGARLRSHAVAPVLGPPAPFCPYFLRRGSSAGMQIR